MYLRQLGRLIVSLGLLVERSDFINKRFLSFLLVLVVVSTLTVSSFAKIIEEEDENGNTILSSDLLSDEENASIADYQEILRQTVSNSGSSSNSDSSSGEGSSTSYLLTISPDDTNGLKSILLDLMGDYEPIVTDYTYRQGSSSYESHSIDVQPDYVWLSSFFIFSLIIYCLFRLGGAMFG